MHARGPDAAMGKTEHRLNMPGTWMTLFCPGYYLVIVLCNNYSETQATAKEFNFSCRIV